MQVTVVGSINRDTSMRVARLVAAGETVPGWDLRHDHGGKGANQAVAAARLGARTAMIACVGNDDAGRESRGALVAEGIDVAGMWIDDDRPTGQAFICVDDAGENSIVIVEGANGALTAERLTKVGASSVADAAVVLCQLEVPLATIAAAARLATGVVVLNPAPALPLSAEILSLVDILVPNAGELAVITGAEQAPTTPRQAAEMARAYGLGRVVVTLGAQGAVVVDGDDTTIIEPVPVRAVDSTAAGDAFCGALAVSLAIGRDLQSAARWAAAAGAAAASTRGAQASLPDLATVDRLAGHDR